MKRINRNSEERKHRIALTLLFSGVIFCLLAVTMLIMGLLVVILLRSDIIAMGQNWLAVDRFILFLTLGSVVLGTGLSILAGRIPLGPINNLINAVNRLASGDFKTRFHFGKVLERHPTMHELSDSFNKMAEELENTEMLRSDFINNFSHEFKTPIMSIAGFAALLKHGALSEEQKGEYIDIIEEESLRLARMATNVLNLSKVENQTILTNVTRFNLSEQIRSCVLLLENKWSRKNLELSLDFDEYEISASEELLRQVWINLIDNAVKFTPEYGLIRISISPQDAAVSISISNTGSPIPPESMGKIFQKFYQADESHASEGNGVGLAVVKKVIDLHGGRIRASSQNNLTTFTVTLPVGTA